MRLTRLTVSTLALGAAALALSCGEPSTTEPGVPLSAVQVDQVGADTNLLQCKPLASDSASAVIGPAGGTLRASRNVLFVPPGAVREPILMSMAAPSDSVNRVEFQPQGYVFHKPVTLTMSFQNCNLSGPGMGPVRVVYTDDKLKVLEVEPSLDDWTGKRVTGLLSHFSQYAVSW